MTSSRTQQQRTALPRTASLALTDAAIRILLSPAALQHAASAWHH